MKKVKKRKLTGFSKLLIKILIVLLILVLIPTGIRIYKSSNLKKLKYDHEAITNILDKKIYSEVVDIGENKTINKVVKEKEFNKELLEKYEKIAYVDQDNLANNINKLLKTGYNTSEISLILTHSTTEVTNDFVKKEYIENISNYLKFDYAKTRYIDRYLAYYKVTRESYDNVVTFVNIGLDKEYYTDTKINDKYSTDMLINKYNGVSEDFEPDNLTKIPSEYCKDTTEDAFLTKEALNAFIEMADAASIEGYKILANSAYRSYKEQNEVYQTYYDLYGEAYVKKYTAKPGFSEHQTGLSLDVASLNSSIFEQSKEFLWMKENSYKYGFILRFPKNKGDITGFKYEAWHYRYVGKDIATYIYENNLTFDEYYARFIDTDK